MSKEKVVAISGYFDPIHVGHIEYINKSKNLGDKLIVILNNDKQSQIKKGKSFMSEDDRKIILENIKSVDAVFISIDEDESVCKSLEKIRPDIFAKGGDRFAAEIPESKTCQDLGIKMIDGLGDKIRSSKDFTGLKK